MSGYEPMSLATLARHLSATADQRVRWKLVWERSTGGSQVRSRSAS